VRASCALPQKPLLIRTGTFVVEIATSTVLHFLRGEAKLTLGEDTVESLTRSGPFHSGGR
jgi:hypothetical protein